MIKSIYQIEIIYCQGLSATDSSNIAKDSNDDKIQICYWYKHQNSDQ